VRCRGSTRTPLFTHLLPPFRLTHSLILQPKDLKAELVEKERQHLKEKLLGKTSTFEEQRARDLALLAEPNVASKGGGAPSLIPRAQDADDDDDDDDDDGSESDASDEDEEAALLAELEKIKRERAEEAAKKAAAEALVEEERKRQDVITGNPLLDLGGGDHGQHALTGHDDGILKRKWYEETVFKNQSKGEPKAKKRFVNDTIRSDFHKRFLDKYIK